MSKNAPTASYAEKGNLDDDSSSMDSFADIVGVEPDSDAEESGWIFVIYYVIVLGML